MNKIIWEKDNNGIFINGCQYNLSFPADGNDYCFNIEDESQWFNHRNDLILFFIKKYALDGDFLDIGGGNGFQCAAIKKSGLNGKVILCEPGYNGCLNAKKRDIEYIYNGVVENFPFERYNISNVGLFDVIEHIENDIDLFNFLYEKLNKGSRVFINVPALKSLWSEIDIYSGHYRRYNLMDINRIIDNTKFKLIDYTYYFNYFVIPLILIRVLPYKLGIRFGHDKLKIREENMHKSKKSLLENLFDIIHKHNINQLKLGKRINIGTSLFFILEK